MATYNARPTIPLASTASWTVIPNTGSIIGGNGVWDTDTQNAKWSSDNGVHVNSWSNSSSRAVIFNSIGHPTYTVSLVGSLFGNYIGAYDNTTLTSTSGGSLTLAFGIFVNDKKTFTVDVPLIFTGAYAFLGETSGATLSFSKAFTCAAVEVHGADVKLNDVATPSVLTKNIAFAGGSLSLVSTADISLTGTITGGGNITLTGGGRIKIGGLDVNDAAFIKPGGYTGKFYSPSTISYSSGTANIVSGSLDKSKTLLIRDNSGDDLSTASIVPGTINGTATLVKTFSGNVATYTLNYTPKSGFVGAQNFTVTYIDGRGNSGSLSFSYSVYSDTEAPLFAIKNQIVGAFKEMDYPAQYYLFIVGSGTVTVVTPPAHGSITIQDNMYVKYIPNGTYVGDDQFTVRVTDSLGRTDTNTITIRVFDAIVNPYIEYREASFAVLSLKYGYSSTTYPSIMDFFSNTVPFIGGITNAHPIYIMQGNNMSSTPRIISSGMYITIPLIEETNAMNFSMNGGEITLFSDGDLNIDRVNINVYGTAQNVNFNTGFPKREKFFSNITVSSPFRFFNTRNIAILYNPNVSLYSFQSSAYISDLTGAIRIQGTPNFTGKSVEYVVDSIGKKGTFKILSWDGTATGTPAFYIRGSESSRAVLSYDASTGITLTLS